jgi:arsenate reductase
LEKKNMVKKKVLFVCEHNSARSQMAEAFLNNTAGNAYSAESAGLEPGKLNPLAVEVMREIGIDISGKNTQGILDLYKQGMQYDYVITVCDESKSGRCPIFPSSIETLHWSFQDPSRFEGSHEEKLQKTRKVRDEIRNKIKEWSGSKM